MGWGRGTLAACVFLLSSYAVAQPQTGLFANKVTGSALTTPPDGFVFPAKCDVTEDSSSPRPLTCDAVSFTVLVNHALASGLAFFVNGDLRAGTDFNLMDVKPCLQPLTGGYTQKCGSQELVGVNRVEPDVTTGTCIPNCDYVQGSGMCSCQAGTSGSCTCFRAWRFTVQPAKFADVGSGMSVCFNATSRTANAQQQQRCVYFDLMVPPLLLSATAAVTAAPIYALEAVVGQLHRISVRSFDMNKHEVVAIDVENTGVELPNQMWEGDSFCSTTGLTSAGLWRPCTSGVWQRNLLYTPRLSEAGMRYSLSFKSMDNGLVSATTVNQTKFSRFTALPGAACNSNFGLCSSAGLAAVSITPAPSLVVTVVQKKPVFMMGMPNKPVYKTPAGQLNEVLGTLEGSPMQGSRLPAAYVNCQMKPFGIFAAKNNSVVSIKLEPSEMSAVSYGLVVTPNVYFWNEAGGAKSDANAYFTYVGVTWTPPLGSEGREYKMCFTASDQLSSSTLCAVLPVVRCMYCTKSAETLKEVAERFSTNWLQIWGANDAEFARMNAATLAASNVVGWSSTQNPDQIDPGVVLRLGPTLVVRNDVRLGSIAQKYRTDVASLLEVNPDLRHYGAGPDDVITAGREVCLLPQICTATADASS